LVTLIDVTDQFEAMCLLAFILPRSRNALDQTTATSTFGASSSRSARCTERSDISTTLAISLTLRNSHMPLARTQLANSIRTALA